MRGHARDLGVALLEAVVSYYYENLTDEALTRKSVEHARTHRYCEKVGKSCPWCAADEREVAREHAEFERQVNPDWPARSKTVEP